MMMLAAIAPAGVLVSMSRSAKCSARPLRVARSIRPAPSTIERLNLSIVATSIGAVVRTALLVAARRRWCGAMPRSLTDQQHPWIIEGDDRDVHGHYPPPPST